jgi:hypothetical protein
MYKYLKLILLFIIFVSIIYVMYKYQNVLLFIPKLIGISFAFLTLIIPRYVDYLPEYLYFSSFKKTDKLKEDKFYNNNLTENDKIIIRQNQKNECYMCKSHLNNNYHVKSTTTIRNNTNSLASYYIICDICNSK